MANCLVLGPLILLTVYVSGVWKPGIHYTLFGTAIALPNLVRDAVLLAIVALSLLVTPKSLRRAHHFEWGEKKAPLARGFQSQSNAGCYFFVSPFASTVTRRLGCRHSISCFMFFWSQFTTGCFSPKPSASIFALSTPLLTR